MTILSVLLGIATLWIAIWIYLPAPTYFLLTFGVGGPEVSHWLILGGIAGIALGIPAFGHSRLALSGVVTCTLAVLLSLGVWVRVPGAIKRFDYATRGMTAAPAAPLRAHAVSFRDLFLGVPSPSARVTTLPHARIYQPAATGTFPVVVQIYGGRWQGGEPADNANFASWLASSGYVVIAIDYRHAPGSPWPAQIDDVNDALRWVAAHAAEYGGDTSRVVLIGRSAGAHLATYAAWLTSPIHIRGVVSYYGPADLVESYKHPPRPDPIRTRAVEEALIGGTLDQMPDRYRDASTVYRLAGIHSPVPPSLLIYGGRDNIVEARYGAKLVSAISATGGQVAYLEIPWAEHAFDAVFNGPSSQIALYHTERFIAWAVR